jgi:hypothetical protein
MQGLLVAKHSLHQQFLSPDTDLSDVELVLGQRFPVLRRLHHPVDPVEAVGCGNFKLNA